MSYCSVTIFVIKFDVFLRLHKTSFSASLLRSVFLLSGFRYE